MQRHSRYLASLISELAKRTDIYSDSGVEGLLSLVLLISLLLSHESHSKSALLSNPFLSQAIEYSCIDDFINLVVRKGSEISKNLWRTGF